MAISDLVQAACDDAYIQGVLAAESAATDTLHALRRTGAISDEQLAVLVRAVCKAITDRTNQEFGAERWAACQARAAASPRTAEFLDVIQ